MASVERRPTADADVVDDPGSARYELVLEGVVVGFLEYEVRGDGVVVLPHAEVDPAHRGAGLADRLVRASLDDLASTGTRIVASCPFVASFLHRHPEYRDLVAR